MAKTTRTWSEIDCGASVDAIAKVSLEAGMVVMEADNVRLAVFVELWVIMTKASCGGVSRAHCIARTEMRQTVLMSGHPAERPALEERFREFRMRLLQISWFLSIALASLREKDLLNTYCSPITMGWPCGDKCKVAPTVELLSLSEGTFFLLS